MSDLQWCTTCDKAIQAYSNSLYCSEECLRQDAINHHPMLGYDFAEFKDFPCRRTSLSPSMISLSPALSTTSTMTSVSPTLSPLPSTYALYRPSSPHHQRQSSTGSMTYPSSLSDDILHLEPTVNTKSNTKHYNTSSILNGPTTQSSLFYH